MATMDSSEQRAVAARLDAATDDPTKMEQLQLSVLAYTAAHGISSPNHTDKQKRSTTSGLA